MYRKKRKFNLARPASNTRIGEERVRKIRTRGGNYKLRALRLETGNFAWASENVTRKSRVIRVVYNSTSNELVRTNTLVKNCVIEVDATPFRLWYEQHYGINLQKRRSGEDGKASKGKSEPVAKKEGEHKEGEKKDAKKDEKKPAGVKKGVEKKDSAKKDAAKPESKEKKEGKEVKKEGKGGKKGEKKEGEEKKPKGVVFSNGVRANRKTKEVKEKLRMRTRQKTRFLETNLESQLSTGRIYVCVTSRPGQTGRCDGYVLEGKELEFYVKKLSKKKSK